MPNSVASRKNDPGQSQRAEELPNGRMRQAVSRLRLLITAAARIVILLRMQF